MGLQILMMHIYRCDLAVSVSGIIKDPLIRIAAGGIECHLIPFPHPAATSLLFYRTQNMKKLSYALRLGVSGNRIELKRKAPLPPLSYPAAPGLCPGQKRFHGYYAFLWTVARRGLF